MEAESLLPGAGGVLFLGVRIEQGGVQIHHYPAVLDRGAGDAPHSLASRRPSGADRGHRVVGVIGEAGDQPGHRRVRRHQAEHPGLRAQHRDVTGGVPTERDRDRQIRDDLTRIMDSERPPPLSEKPCELPGQTTAPRGLDQQHATGMRHQRLATGDHGQPGTQVFMLVG